MMLDQLANYFPYALAALVIAVLIGVAIVAKNKTRP